MSWLFLNDSLEFPRPSRLLSLDPEELLSPTAAFRYPVGYLRPWRHQAAMKDTGATVSIEKDKFRADLDVQQFKPEELSVKVSGNVVTVEGKHEEKQDHHGFISRHFVRKYVVPDGHDLEKIESKLSSDGILSIIAPKVKVENGDDRSIPVIQTGQPSKIVEQKEEEKKEE